MTSFSSISTSPSTSGGYPESGRKHAWQRTSLRIFDKHIANLVMQVTDVSRRNTAIARVRKAIDRQYLAGASWQGQMIKCADMLSNTKDIVADDLRFARVYVPEKQLLIDD
jgi:hypothetical protein